MKRNLNERYAHPRWLVVGAPVVLLWGWVSAAAAEAPLRQQDVVVDAADPITTDPITADPITTDPIRTARVTNRSPGPGAARAWRSPPWLKWPLAGLGIASTITSVTAWQVRNRFAEHWNSDACLRDGQTRVQVCSDDYHAGKDMERVSWVGGALSIALLGGAVSSWLFEKPAHVEPSIGRAACRLSGWGGVCSGTF